MSQCKLALTNSIFSGFYESLNPEKYQVYTISNLSNINESPDILIQSEIIDDIEFKVINPILLKTKFPKVSIINNFRFNKSLFTEIFKLYGIPYLNTLLNNNTLLKESTIYNLFKILDTNKLIFKPVNGARSLGIFTLNESKAGEFVAMIRKNTHNDNDKPIETLIKELVDNRIIELPSMNTYHDNEKNMFYKNILTEDNKFQSYIVQPFIKIDKEYRLYFFRNYKDMDYTRVLIYNRLISTDLDELGELLFNDKIVNLPTTVKNIFVDNLTKSNVINKLNEMLVGLDMLCISVDIAIDDNSNLTVLEFNTEFEFECSKGLVPDYLEDSIESLH